LRTIRESIPTPADAARAVTDFLANAWAHRMRFSYASYVLVFLFITASATVFLQWSVYNEPTYADPAAVDDYTKAWDSIRGQITKFVAQSWLQNNNNALLNFLILGLMYLVLVFLLNRFWIATAVFSIAMTSFAVANHIKIALRSEPIIPSDLSFLSGGNTGEIWSFIPQDDLALVYGSIRMLVWLTVICVVLQVLDGRKCVIPFHWKHPFRNPKVIAGNCTRLVAVIVSAATLFSFTWNLGIPGSWSYEWAKSMNDSPMLWDSLSDARNNGPAMNFLRLAHAKTMDKPDGYSKAAMAEIAEKYASAAKKTNATRANEMTDSTVIMILSESFSDPTRVPGIEFTQDPMPNIRSIKETTTSGLMLSPGYGGGTANIEYQSLTGLNLGLFDDSMQSPYQELVPHQKNPYTFNQIWNTKYGQTGSVAFHPFYKNMYLRDSDYKKFGFSHFYTLDSDPAITHQDRIDNSTVVSDAASYQNVLDALSSNTEHPQFIQLVTMQNHMPYNDWYADNQFKEADVSQIGDGEKYSVDTYAKGVNLTDQATFDFLSQLDQMDKPITVIFYGDHLPGIYTTANSDKNNALALHETDYFIWSNQASVSAGTKLDDKNAGYTSSNFFMAQAAEHMDAKISPYLTLLTELHDQLPALGRLVLQAGGFDENASTIYLSADGTTVKRKNLSKQAKQLLKEYRLVQYDLTAGKGYLNDTDFFKVG
ncbi:LTA synthase family protein, partial [Bifidobacterium sp. SO1]|uniref:LTA synthase family protein n=1 Tax=Bifidobacterium sp. SO1 TaxID=2809029 RepID=UPI003204AE8B